MYPTLRRREIMISSVLKPLWRIERTSCLTDGKGEKSMKLRGDGNFACSLFIAPQARLIGTNPANFLHRAGHSTFLMPGRPRRNAICRAQEFRLPCETLEPT